MLLNILTGFNGVTKRPRAEIVVLVSSLPRLDADGIPYVVADRNASLVHATFSSGQAGLSGLPWAAWKGSNFKHDPNDPEKHERYQAEALVHGILPANALRAIITADNQTQVSVSQAVSNAALSIPVITQVSWYP